MQDLKEEVIQEESRCQTNFLSTCQATLLTSPVEFKGMLVASYQVLLGAGLHILPIHLITKDLPSRGNSLLQQLLLHQFPRSPLGSKGSILPQILCIACLMAETTSKTASEEPPSSKTVGGPT